jgi:hypothetical protein
MFIPEKYLLTKDMERDLHDGDPANGITVLKCKYCGREFVATNNEADKIDVKNVCEDSACIAAYQRDEMAAKVAEIKNAAGGIVNNLKDNMTDQINKALGK